MSKADLETALVIAAVILATVYINNNFLHLTTRLATSTASGM